MTNPYVSAQNAVLEQAWVEYRDHMKRSGVSPSKLRKRDFLAGRTSIDAPYDGDRRAQLIHRTVEQKAEILELATRVKELESALASIEFMASSTRKN